jgi:hypothetical protein
MSVDEKRAADKIVISDQRSEVKDYSSTKQKASLQSSSKAKDDYLSLLSTRCDNKKKLVVIKQ